MATNKLYINLLNLRQSWPGSIIESLSDIFILALQGSNCAIDTYLFTTLCAGELVKSVKNKRSKIARR